MVGSNEPAVLASKHPVFSCVWMTCISQAGVPEGGAMYLSFMLYLLLYLFVFYGPYQYIFTSSSREQTVINIKVKEMLKWQKMWNLHVELAGLLHTLAWYWVALIIF